MTEQLSRFRATSDGGTGNGGRQAADSGLADSLVELAAAPTRVYYDAAEDDRMRDMYYADINAEQGACDLFGQLRTLLCTSHARQLSYKPSKYVYPWVDLHPDLNVHSIYSGVVYDPRQLIDEDYQTDEQRWRQARELLACDSVRNLDALQEELDLLEAALPYNCEHSVPQSWFAKKQPMRGDLHHLFACESGCNSFRGNQAYFDFTDFDRVVRDECGKREENRFEPSSRTGKGVVARATLYFLIRYPGKIAAAGGEFDSGRLPMLLDWHQQTPPDEYEKHRNTAIFAVQGNRNPLIDYPDWAEKIDFQLGFGQ